MPDGTRLLEDVVEFREELVQVDPIRMGGFFDALVKPNGAAIAGGKMVSSKDQRRVWVSVPGLIDGHVCGKWCWALAQPPCDCAQGAAEKGANSVTS